MKNNETQLNNSFAYSCNVLLSSLDDANVVINRHFYLNYSTERVRLSI